MLKTLYGPPAGEKGLGVEVGVLPCGMARFKERQTGAGGGLGGEAMHSLLGAMLEWRCTIPIRV